MAQWAQLPTHEGCVFTRGDHTLARGEMTSAKNVRYKRGDNVQLHRDFGRSLFSETKLEDLKHLSSEKADDTLIGLVSTKRRITLYTAPAELSGEWTERYSITTSTGPFGLGGFKASDYLGVVHRGDEYFLGFGSGRGVRTTDGGLTYTDIGMKSIEQTGLAFTGERTVDQAPTVAFTGTVLMDNPRIGLMNDVCTFSKYSYSSLPFGLVPAHPAENFYGTFMYFVTEYDKDAAVESVPYYAKLFAFAPDSLFDDFYGASFVFGNLALPLSGQLQYSAGTGGETAFGLRMDFSGYTPHNERTTHLRVYRHLVSSGAVDGATFALTQNIRQETYEYANAIYADTLTDGTYGRKFYERSAGFPLGGLIGEVEVGSSDPTLIDFPETLDDPDGVVISYFNGTTFLQTPPKAWDQGVLFGDSLVLNMFKEPSVLQYSPPGQPEYFPDINVLPMLSEGRDDILGIYNMDNFIFVLTSGGAHRVNYLPTSTDASREAVDLVSTDGCTGRRAHALVTMPQGLVTVWVSGSQLNLSSGAGAVNACEDWSIDAAGLDRSQLSRAVLLNNAGAGRLELHCALEGDEGNQHVFHFYYTRTHLKGTGFKCTGPHDGFGLYNFATSGSAARDDLIWCMSDAGTEVLNRGITTEAMEVSFGRLYNPRNVMTRIGVFQAALHHNPLSRESDGSIIPIELQLQAKSFNNTPNPTKVVYWDGTSGDEVDLSQVRGVSGNYIKATIRYSGTDAQSWGPIWLEEEVSADGQ